MKKNVFPFALALLSFLFVSFPVVAQNLNAAFDSWQVEPKPKFHEPGYKDFSEWVQAHMVYPESAQKNKMEGIVQVSFVVEKDGSVSNARVYNSLGRSIDEGEEDNSIAPDLDQEAVRVVLGSPIWTPGRFENKTVRTKMGVDVVFSLSGGEYEAPVSTVDKKPSFYGGGLGEFEEWIKTQIVLSNTLKERGDIRHRVNFTIDKNGDVINVNQPLHISHDKDFDNQLIKVVRSSPVWQPASKDGRPVKYELSVLVDFSKKTSASSVSHSQTASSSNSGSQSSVQHSGTAIASATSVPTWITNHDWREWGGNTIRFLRSGNSNDIVCRVSEDDKNPCDASYSYSNNVLVIRYENKTIRFTNIPKTDPTGHAEERKIITQEGEKYYAISKQISLRELPIVLEHTVWQYVEGTRQMGMRLQMEFLDSERVRFNHITYVFGKEDYINATYNYAAYRDPEDKYIIRIQQEVYTESSGDKPVSRTRKYELKKDYDGQYREIYEYLPDKVRGYKFIGYNR